MQLFLASFSIARKKNKKKICEKTTRKCSQSDEEESNTKEELSLAFAVHAHTVRAALFTIFLSFNAAVKKVTQLSPVYRHSARFLYIKRFDFFFAAFCQFVVFFFVCFLCTRFFFLLCRVHVFAFRFTEGGSGGPSGPLRLHKCNSPAPNWNELRWEVVVVWSIVAIHHQRSTSSRCPINLFAFCCALRLSWLSLSASLSSMFLSAFYKELHNRNETMLAFGVLHNSQS